jgi:hypothetical protein
MVVDGHPPLDSEKNECCFVTSDRPFLCFHSPPRPFCFHLQSPPRLFWFHLQRPPRPFWFHLPSPFLFLRVQYFALCMAAQSGVPVDGVAFWLRASSLEFVRRFGAGESVSGAVVGVRKVFPRVTMIVHGGDDIVKP